MNPAPGLGHDQVSDPGLAFEFHAGSVAGFGAALLITSVLVLWAGLRPGLANVAG